MNSHIGSSLKNYSARIKRHDDLPSNAQILGQIVDFSAGGELVQLVRRGHELSILCSHDNQTICGKGKYYCYQFDFPLELIQWFPIKLRSFIRINDRGAIQSRGPMSIEDCVGGENLSLAAHSSYLTIINTSRRCPLPDRSARPSELDLSYSFIFNGGFLTLISNLRNKESSDHLT